MDIPFQWLTFFEPDDEELSRIGKEYGEGRMFTGEVKAILIAKLTEMVNTHQDTKAGVTEEMVQEFMRIRPLTWVSPPVTFVEKPKAEGAKAAK